MDGNGKDLAYYDVAVQGSILYALCQTYQDPPIEPWPYPTGSTQSFLQVLDMSDLSAPVVLDSYQLLKPISNDVLQVSGSVAYIAGAVGFSPMIRGGLTTYDVSSPTSVRRLGSYTLDSGSVKAAAIVGSTAYLLASNLDADNLLVIDVSQPSTPVLLTRVQGADDGSTFSAVRFDLEARDGRLYAFLSDADLNSALTVYDISQADRPLLMTRQPVSYFEVSLVGDQLYGSLFDGHLEVRDLAGPSGAAGPGRYACFSPQPRGGNVHRGLAGLRARRRGRTAHLRYLHAIAARADRLLRHARRGRRRAGAGAYRLRRRFGRRTGDAGYFRPCRSRGSWAHSPRPAMPRMCESRGTWRT